MAARNRKNDDQKSSVRVKLKKKKGPERSSSMLKRSMTVVLLLVVIGFFLLGMVRLFAFFERTLYAENSDFEIQHLLVSSDGSMVSEDILRESSKVSEGMNLWEFTFDQIEERLSKVAYVESVYLERQLPHTLIIRVKERVPVALVMGKEEVQYPNSLDQFGHVLPYRHQYAELPVIVGVELPGEIGRRSIIRPGQIITESRVNAALEILSVCRENPNYEKYLQIEKLDVSGAEYIMLALRGGTQVRMPRYSIRNKIYKLVAALQAGQARGERYREMDMTLDVAKVPVVPY